MTVDDHLREHPGAAAAKRDWERSASFVWAAAALVAIGLVAATFAFGDLVERSHLHGWVRTEGLIVAVSGGDVAIRYAASGEQIETVLDSSVNPGHKAGERAETWFDPAHPRRFVLASDTPLHNLPVATGVGLTAVAIALALLGRASRLRASARRAWPTEVGAALSTLTAPTARPSGAGDYPARDWLYAAGVPFVVCLSALGWLVAHPESEGSPQLSLALLSYLATLFGVSRWLRAERAAMVSGQPSSSAA